MARNIVIPRDYSLEHTLLSEAGVGSSEGPGAYLLGRLNLLPTHEVEIDVGAWASQNATLTRVFDRHSLHGRYVLNIEDISAASNGYAWQDLDNVQSVQNQTFFVAFNVKRGSGDSSVMSIELSDPAVGSTASVATVSVQTGIRTYVWWVTQLTGAEWSGVTELRLKLHPQSATVDTGEVEIENYRVHRVFTDLTQLPRDPPMNLRWSRRANDTAGRGLQFGGRPARVVRGTFVDAVASWPYVDEVSIAALASMANAQGYVFARPDTASGFGFLADPIAEPLEPVYALGKLIGYSLSTTIEGAEPLYGTPLGVMYHEDATGKYLEGPPVFKQATQV